MEKSYLAIDLKSFYASVECVERGLDPLRVHLVVADQARTEKTICLAVSPPLKAQGVPSRARLFEVIQTVSRINRQRKKNAPHQKFRGSSHLDEALSKDPSLALDFLIAPPRMGLYMQYSTRIYEIYKEFIAPEDIHVYSIDEVFMDVTNYLKMYKTTASELAMKIVLKVFAQTGITATAGVGSNLYLCKVAMDIVAKRVPPDKNGVRIAELDEKTYRELLWDHRPLTDFWRVGKGYAEKLEENGLYTMGDIARCSLRDEDKLYRMFGVNAELLIDHAWGYEPCTIADIKNYRPQKNSLGSGQVLSKPYDFEKTKLVLREMTDLAALELVEKGLVTDQIVLTVGYDTENLSDPVRRAGYAGEVTFDRYGRQIPKHGHGTENLSRYTSSSRLLTQAAMRLFERIADPSLLVRRIYLCFCRVIGKDKIPPGGAEQLDLFHDYEREERRRAEEEERLEKERSVQEAVIAIHKKFGKNALVKGMNLEEGATAIERNGTVGGHKKE